MHKQWNKYGMNNCDKSITSTIKMLTALIQSYRFNQIKNIPLTSLSTHWIIWTIIFYQIYNEKEKSFSDDACDLRLR